MTHFFSDWYFLSIRNIKLIWRPLLALIPSLFIPLFFFFVNAVAFKSVTALQGFPVESYAKFVAPVAVFTAVFFAAGNAGIELVVDISSGYFNKLLIMPINRLTIVLSKLTEVAAQSLLQGGIVLIMLQIFGFKVVTGFLGVVTMFALLIIFAMAWSCLGMIFALLTRNPRLVQSLFVLVFPFLYITTGQMPKEFLPKTYAMVVSYNPVTYVIEGTRALMIYGWHSPAIGEGFAVSIVVFIIMVALTLQSFKKTLK